MSDRVNIITVALEKSFRDDECEPILNAIRMIKGVLNAKINVASSEDFWAEAKARHSIEQKLLKVIYPE